MGKIMIGSFGTLAVITSVNFRRSCLAGINTNVSLHFDDLDVTMEKQDTVFDRRSLRPASIDILSPAGSRQSWMRMDSCLRYVPAAVRSSVTRAIRARTERVRRSQRRRDISRWWKSMTDFTADFLAGNLQVSFFVWARRLRTIGALKLVSGTVVCRAGSGVTYIYLSSWRRTSHPGSAAADGWTAVVDSHPMMSVHAELWVEPKTLRLIQRHLP